MTKPMHNDQFAADQFARKITVHLGMSTEQLPYVVTERLRASRVQALLMRKRAEAPLPYLQTAASTSSILLDIGNDGTATLGSMLSPSHQDNTPLWLRRLLTGLPLVALLGALAFISADQDNRATVDVANIDAALLTSELPPAAYTDPGFEQYLQSSISDSLP